MGEEEGEKSGNGFGRAVGREKMAPGAINLRLRHLHGFDWG
jgi:hypothetical protein